MWTKDEDTLLSYYFSSIPDVQLLSSSCVTHFIQKYLLTDGLFFLCRTYRGIGIKLGLIHNQLKVSLWDV